MTYSTKVLILQAQTVSITSDPSNTAICTGSNTSFTVTASNAVSYQWQVNTGSGFGNVSNTGVYSGATSATLSITGATAGMNGYAYQCVVTGAVPPNATSNSATLTVSMATWLGTSNSSWSNTANWSCGTLSTGTTAVTIPSGTTFSPLVDITTAICNTLTINSGAVLAFSGTTNVLEVKGSITNNGTFTVPAALLNTGKVAITTTSLPTGIYYLQVRKP